jgi:hypothetical protein
MNKGTKIVLGIVFIAIFLLLIYQQIEIENLKPAQPQPTTHPTVNSTPTPSTTSNPTSNPTTTSTIPSGYTEVPSTTVSTNLEVIPQGGYLVLNGNVTNKSPNTLYNVGLHVYSWGYPFIQGGPETLIDDVVPIASGTYPNYQELKLSTLEPYQTISVIITIYSNYDERTPTLYGNTVTVIQAK